MDKLQKLLSSTQQKLKTDRTAHVPVIKSSFNDLPVYEVTYPNNNIKVQHIAPYDEELKTLLTKYFPRGLSKETLKPGERPRSLSLRAPGYPGDVEWNTKTQDVAYAMSISLYEQDLEQGACVGDPIADCCAVIATKNNIVMVCADGCGWGEASRTAARIAVLAMLKTLTHNVFRDVYSSKDIFEYLNSGMNAVQQELVKSGGAGLTTLCATVISPLKNNTQYRNADRQWVVCNVRVGDTATYRYCSQTQQLVLLSHEFCKAERDMRNCGGCLGPVVGYEPDLGNLEYSVSLADGTSTIFLATDGVGDNFNPYVTNQLSGTTMTCSDFPNALLHKVYCSCLNDDSLGNSCDLKDLPKHKELTVSVSDKALHESYCKSTCNAGDREQDQPTRSKNLCPVLVDILSLKYFQQTINSQYIDPTVEEFVRSICWMLIQSTDRKRTAMCRFRTRLSELSADEAGQISRCHRKYVKTIPGKLDHASIVAVNLGKVVSLDSYCLRSSEPSTAQVTFNPRNSPMSMSLDDLLIVTLCDYEEPEEQNCTLSTSL